MTDGHEGPACGGDRRLVPLSELQMRVERCRRIMDAMLPDEAGGLLCTARADIYYLTGTLANGLCWLPREGEPVLLVRKGAERCRLESPWTHVGSYASFGEVEALCADAGSPLTSCVAVDKRAMPWNTALLLQARLPGVCFLEGGGVTTRMRAVKTGYELERMRRAASLHRHVLIEAALRWLHPGMTERGIAHALWDDSLACGHGGQTRVTHGEAPFLGSVSAGVSGNYPVSSISPTGAQGEHPAMPVMGYAGQVWLSGQPLLVDTAFVTEGYHSDMTVTFWAGSPASVPDSVRRCHDACVCILRRCAAMLRPGVAAVEVWREAARMAAALHVTEGFMGLGGNYIPFIGHGIGLAMEEWPALASASDMLLELDMTIALEPKIGIPGMGMVGCEGVFRVSEQGGEALYGDWTPELLCCS